LNVTVGLCRAAALGPGLAVITNRVSCSYPTLVTASARSHARDLYHCDCSAKPLSADRSEALDHGGLDPMPAYVAPWLLGCPGTRRQHPVSAARVGFRRPDKMAAPGTSRHRLTPGQHVILEQGSGLLIRGFGVRVPGGAPVMTWDFIPGLSFSSVVVWAEVGRGMARCPAAVWIIMCALRRFAGAVPLSRSLPASSRLVWAGRLTWRPGWAQVPDPRVPLPWPGGSGRRRPRSRSRAGAGSPPRPGLPS